MASDNVARVRLAFIIDTIENWQAGTERFVKFLCTYLDPDLFEVEICLLKRSEDFSRIAFPCPVFVASDHIGGRLPYLKVFWRLFQHLKDRSPAIAQTFFVDGTIIGSIASRLAGVRIVIASRRNAGYWRSRKYDIPFKVVKRIVDGWQCNSEAVAQTLREEGVSSQQIAVIRNPVDTAFFRPSDGAERAQAREQLAVSRRTFVIVCVANLRPPKRLDTLIYATAIIRQQLPDICTLLVGEGPLRSNLEAIVREANLDQNFRFLGRQLDVRPYLAGADVGVLTSSSEGSSNAVLEYLASGLPVVVSDIPANSEFIQDFVFPVGDARQLSLRVLDLASNPELRLHMAKQNRLKALQFSQEKCIQAAQSYYLQLLDRRLVT